MTLKYPTLVFGSTQQGVSTGFSTGVDVDPYPASKRAEFHISFSF